MIHYKIQNPIIPTKTHKIRKRPCQSENEAQDTNVYIFVLVQTVTIFLKCEHFYNSVLVRIFACG